MGPGEQSSRTFGLNFVEICFTLSTLCLARTEHSIDYNDGGCRASIVFVSDCVFSISTEHSVDDKERCCPVLLCLLVIVITRV